MLNVYKEKNANKYYNYSDTGSKSINSNVVTHYATGTFDIFKDRNIEFNGKIFATALIQNYVMHPDSFFFLHNRFPPLI